jgi:hypothetical protein
MYEVIGNTSQHSYYPNQINYEHYDVLIIGSGLTGALITHEFLDKGIKCALVDIPTIIPLSSHYQMDTELQQLSQLMDQPERNLFFKEVINAIGRLDVKVNQLGEDCDYRRNPKIIYTSDDEVEGFELYPGLLTYNSGIHFNADQLVHLLKKDAISKTTPVYDHSNIREIEINQTDTVVTINENQKLHCNKVVISDEIVFSNFFNDELQISQNNSIIKCSSHCENPYIGENDEYPNVYFNVGNHSILNGLIVSHFLSDLYLNSVINNPNKTQYN